jgi:stage V sporulation protein G
MEITDINIRRIDSDGKMKAVVSVTFDNDFVVHDIKVIESANGLFIAMPSRKTPDGEYKDIAHPINSKFRERLAGAVLTKYQALLEIHAAAAATAAAAAPAPVSAVHPEEEV